MGVNQVSEATLHQKIIDLRSDVIKMRIQKENDKQVIQLMQSRNDNLELALSKIIDICKHSEIYTNEANIHYIAYSTLHSD